MRLRVPPLLAVLLLALLAPLAARADDATGAWDGSVDVPGQKLDIRVVFPDTAHGIIDIPVQHVMAAPLKDVNVSGETLAFTLQVPGAPAVFSGKRSGETVTGTLAQAGQSYPFTLKRTGAVPPKLAPLPAVSAKDAGGLLGTWSGTIGKGGDAFDVELVLRAAGDAVGGTLAIPRQCLRDQKVTSVGRAADGILRIAAQGKLDTPLTFDGKLEGESLAGTLLQNGSTSPFTLRRAAATALPYDSEDVTYPSGDVTIAATLTRPRGAARAPAVILLTGSGPQNRDECVLGVRPFAAIADSLARAGVAVLRSDDRGVGGSGGSMSSATPVDFAADAAAAVAYLRGRADIDPSGIGLLGHSEGGAIAPLVAVKDPKIAFIVLLAGPGTPLAEIMVDQLILIDRAEGMDAKLVDAESRLLRDILATFRASRPGASKAKIVEIAKRDLPADLLGKLGGPDQIAERYTAQFDNAWLRFYLDYDPAATLAQVKCPVLAVNGARDLQVPPRKNLDAIRAAVKKGKNRDVKIVELPGLNHLFQKAKTGSPSEYATLPPTIDPALLDTVTTWVTAHVHR